ncbi:hypothetical protein CK203_014380 [Vitis vinifera]|uniref:Retrovirus-related Pol polyprotein from transposon RE1 n=1 Tax=Vitis vinifera TaxID=29760 RepID=A0A438K4X6_VITVI|nr:hypothetical protein CK203_014380 [Vitis vinifera]
MEDCKLKIEDNKKKMERIPRRRITIGTTPPQQVQGESSQDLPKEWKFVINHPQDQIIGNPSSGHDGRAQLLSWTSNQATKGRNLHQSSKVYKRSSQKVQHGGSQTMKTPMSSSIKLDKDEKGKSIDSTMYRGMIGSLLYLTLVDPTLCIVYACVLDFNLVLKNLT